MPEEPGIYRISNPLDPATTIRAGRTKTAAGGLRQRVYQNHLMGAQAGNLRAQLITDGVCPDHLSAKRYIRDTLAVQIWSFTTPRSGHTLNISCLQYSDPSTQTELPNTGLQPTAARVILSRRG